MNLPQLPPTANGQWARQLILRQLQIDAQLYSNLGDSGKEQTNSERRPTLQMEIEEFTKAKTTNDTADWLYRRAMAAFNLAIRYQAEIPEETYQQRLDMATRLWKEGRENDEE